MPLRLISTTSPFWILFCSTLQIRVPGPEGKLVRRFSVDDTVQVRPVRERQTDRPTDRQTVHCIIRMSVEYVYPVYVRLCVADGILDLWGIGVLFPLRLDAHHVVPFLTFSFSPLAGCSPLGRCFAIRRSWIF